MKKARNTAEGFALRALAASRRTEEDERLVSHHDWNLRPLLRRQGIDVHSSSRSVEAHIPIDQRKNRVVATEADILAR